MVSRMLAFSCFVDWTELKALILGHPGAVPRGQHVSWVPLGLHPLRIPGWWLGRQMEAPVLAESLRGRLAEEAAGGGPVNPGRPRGWSAVALGAEHGAWPGASEDAAAGFLGRPWLLGLRGGLSPGHLIVFSQRGVPLLTGPFLGGRPCHCPSDLLRVGPSACHDGDSPSGSSQPSSPDARCEAAVQVNTGSARALSPACTRLELSWPQVSRPGGEPAGGRPVGPVTTEFRVCIHGLTFLLAARPPGNLPWRVPEEPGSKIWKVQGDTWP